MSGTAPLLACSTPAEVRAIPNLQWEEWLASRRLPPELLAAPPQVLRVVSTILRATKRRMEAGLVDA